MTTPRQADTAGEHGGPASIAAALVQPYDVVGTSVAILTAAAGSAGATGGGLILLQDEPDRLQLLAATSHRAEELELYQAQRQQGPCFDAAVTGRSVIASTAADIDRRWPDVAAAFRRAGVVAVHAVPLRWRGEVIGALNLFFAVTKDESEPRLQVFADLASLAIINAVPVSGAQVLARIRAGLDERTVIEQAKGVLAQQYHLDMEAAYQLLLATAARQGELLAITAAGLVAGASDRSG